MNLKRPGPKRGDGTETQKIAAMPTANKKKVMLERQVILQEVRSRGLNVVLNSNSAIAGAYW